LHHGEAGNGDDLLKCYSNTPFGMLFEATRELKAFYQPFLDELKK